MPTAQLQVVVQLAGGAHWISPVPASGAQTGGSHVTAQLGLIQSMSHVASPGHVADTAAGHLISHSGLAQTTFQFLAVTAAPLHSCPTMPGT